MDSKHMRPIDVQSSEDVNGFAETSSDIQIKEEIETIGATKSFLKTGVER